MYAFFVLSMFIVTFYQVYKPPMLSVLALTYNEGRS